MKGRRSTTELGEARAKKTLKVGERRVDENSIDVADTEECNVINLPLVSDTVMDTSDEEIAPSVVPPLVSNVEAQHNIPTANLHFSMDFERMMKTVEDNITKHLDEKLLEHQKIIAKELERCNDMICNRILELGHLKASSNAVNGGHQTKSKKNAYGKLKSEFNARNDEELISYDLCFCPDNIKLIMNIVIINYTIMNVNHWSYSSNQDEELLFNFETSCVRKLEAIMFGKSSLEGKSVWKGSVGNEASNLRYMIQKSLVKNAQQNKFDSCKFERIESRDGELNQNASNSHSYSTARSLTNNSKLPYPIWLLNIKDEHISTVRSQREKKKLSAKLDKTNEIGIGGVRWYDNVPNDEQVCLRAMERLYTDITSEIHDGRIRARSLFSEEVGYLFCIGKRIKSNISDKPLSSPSYTFPEDWKTIIIDPVDIATMECDVADDAVIKRNEEKFQKFCQKTGSYFSFHVEHDVILNSDNVQQKRRKISNLESVSMSGISEISRGKSFVKLRRHINLLLVALNMIVTFSCGNLKQPIGSKLCGRRDILKSCFIIATALKTMILLSGNDIGIKHDVMRRKSQVRISDLMTSPTVIDRIGRKMVTNVTVENYKAMHVEDEVEHINDSNGHARSSEHEEEDLPTVLL